MDGICFVYRLIISFEIILIINDEQKVLFNEIIFAKNANNNYN